MPRRAAGAAESDHQRSGGFVERVDVPGGDDEVGAPKERPVLPSRWSDAELVAAMRRNEAGAFREFFARFAPLVTAMARARRMPADVLAERVGEFLDDAAMRLSRLVSPPPTALAAYLAASFRRRDYNHVRDLRCRERLRDAYAVDAGAGSERAILSATSEDAVRTSHGPGWEGAALAPAIERLALVLEEGITDDERQLLAWLGARVPQREIALWLGVTHGAIRVRITRLRARLRDAAMRHAFRLEGTERAELARFFRRAEIEIPVGAGDGVQCGGRSGDGSRKVEEEER